MPATATAVKWLTKVEAASELNISEGQVRRLVRDGRLSGDYGEGELRIKAASVTALKAAREAAREAAIPLPPAKLPTRVATQLEAFARMAEAAAAQSAPKQLAGEVEPEEDEEKSYTPEPKRPPRAFCTIAEAARFFGLRPRWLLELVRTGAIPAIDVGSLSRESWRLDRDQLIAAVRAIIASSTK